MDTRLVPEEKLIINCENFNETSVLEQCIKTEIFVDNTAIGLITHGRDDELIEKLSRICRCCLVERNDLRSLFDEQNSKISMITLLSQVQIAPDDGLPQSICERCLELLIKAVNFRQQILNADMSLRHYIAVGYTEGKELKLLEFEQLSKTMFNNAATNVEKVDRSDQMDNTSMLSKEANDQLTEHIFIQKTENSESVIIISSNAEGELKEISNDHYNDFEHQKIMKTKKVRLTDEMQNQRIVKDDISSEENSIHTIDHFFVPKSESCDPIIIDSNMEKELKEKTNKHEDHVEQEESIKIEIIEQLNDSDEASGKVHQEEETKTERKIYPGENTNEKHKRRSSKNIKSKISFVNEKNNCLEPGTNNVMTSTCSKTYENLKYKPSKMLHSMTSKCNNATPGVIPENESEKQKNLEDDRNERPTRTSARNILNLMNGENDSLKSVTDNIESSSCSVCQDLKCQCSSKSYLEYNQKKIVNNEDMNNACRYETSPESFGNESNLHIDDSVLENNDQFGFDEKQPSLNSHNRIHSGNRRFNCRSVLVDQIPIHTEEQTYVCKLCDKNFASLTSLKYHLSTHSVKEKYTCNHCNKKFTHHCTLIYHIRTHSGEKPFVCDICDKQFSTSSNLQVHLTIHSGDRKYSCDQCSKKFSRPNHLVKHIRTHTGEKPYVCKICDKKFAYSSNLKCHLTIHSVEKKYACDRCSKGFTTHRSLVQHIRTHTGEKPYVCEQCSRRFTLQSTLIKHIRTHTGEKPYVCNICDKKFIFLTNLKYHLKTHSDKKMKG